MGRSTGHQGHLTTYRRIMSLSVETVESIAPDQASLKAAAKLMKPAKWPVLSYDSDGSNLIWGDCQGSGANPYRVVVDKGDHGYKCTCPSRKFPCKHALALMWMYAESSSTFAPGEVPEWAHEWVGRRRKTTSPQATPPVAKDKNIALATTAPPAKAVDPKAEARKEAAAKKRAAQTHLAILSALEDLDQWLQDQLSSGLANLRKDLPSLCRKIAARLVDGKAAALAGRLDELPSRILSLPLTLQTEALIAELGQLKLLSQAWRVSPQAPDLTRLISSSEKRQEILDSPSAPRHQSQWEVITELIRSRRDGLVEQATWLLNLSPTSEAPRFACLLDFYPASAGKRGPAHTPGTQFTAELAFYPGTHLSRAILVTQEPLSTTQDWPVVTLSPRAQFQSVLHDSPWSIEVPLLLQNARLGLDAQQQLWLHTEDDHYYPVLDSIPALALGVRLHSVIGLWNGFQLTLLTAHTNIGRLNLVP